MNTHDILPRSTNLKSNLFALFITILALLGFLSLQSKPIFQAKNNSLDSAKQQTEITWAIKPTEKPEPSSRKFIEANPNSPINPPDDTDNFSFRDQQAAQPTKTGIEPEDDLPALEGVEFSSKVAPSSQESPQLRKLPEVPEIEKPPKEKLEAEKQNKPISTPRNMQVAQAEATEQNGLQVKDHEEDGKDKVINLSKKPTEFDSIQEDKKIASLQTPAVSTISTRPRPRLSPELLRGPVMKTISSAPRVGVLAVECRLHPYGVYVQEMLRSIEDQWHHLAHGSLRFLQKDKMKAKITYRFTLRADGTIVNLSFIGNGDGALPAELCRQAIASRVPFGEWTQKMIDDFGQSDEITIHFNYR